MWRSVEHQAEFSPLLWRPVLFRCQEHPKFQWHVKPRQFGFSIQLSARDVVDTDTALGDDPQNLCYSHLACVGELQSTASNVTAVVNSEDDRVEKLSIRLIERAVNEDAQFVFAAHPRRRAQCLVSEPRLVADFEESFRPSRVYSPRVESRSTMRIACSICARVKVPVYFESLTTRRVFVATFLMNQHNPSLSRFFDTSRVEFALRLLVPMPRVLERLDLRLARYAFR